MDGRGIGFFKNNFEVVQRCSYVPFTFQTCKLSRMDTYIGYTQLKHIPTY